MPALRNVESFIFTYLFLPNNLRSKLNNMFLFVLLNSLDRKLLKNSNVFCRVIEELMFLEKESLTLMINNKEIILKFQLALILGDNLGIHSIFNFSESFRACYPCRFCLTPFKDMNQFFTEDKMILRNESKYKEDIQNLLNDGTNSHNIVEEWVFHKLDSFHVTKNLVVDVMHDIWEGIALYDIGKILNEFINVKKFFSLEHFHHRISAYSFHIHENKPPTILENHVKIKLKLSSAETMALFRNFPLFIGDLIPENNPHWNLYLKLKKVVDIVMETVSHQNSHVHLKVRV